MEEVLTIYDTCIKITSALEGTDYSTVTNSFDGMGISCGVLQWNLGTGTLQSFILNKCNLNEYKFPVPITPLQNLSKEDAVIFSKDVMHNEHGILKKEWIDAWKAFLTSPGVINLQKRAIDKYFHQAKCLAGELGMSHDNKHVMAWCFDTAVQSWSLGIGRPEINKSQAENIITIYGTSNSIIWSDLTMNKDQQLLVIASHLRALKCNPRWRNDFFNRKCTIAMKAGYVHGVKYDFKKILP